MRMFFCVLIFLPFFSIAQKNEVEVKALKWFKNVYVENNFKDPYSFKLLKISSVSKSAEVFYKSILIEPKLNIISGIDHYYEDVLTANRLDTIEINSKIEFTLKLRNNPNSSESLKEKYTDNILLLFDIKRLMTEFVSLSEERKKMIGANLIYIDFYASNSFGNKILNRYAFYYFPKRSPLYKSYKKYSYSDFMIDEEFIFKLN